MLEYVLLTAARNEAAYLPLTLDAVAAQTVRPVKWLIVSDGSTDGTDALVAARAAKQPYIELVRAGSVGDVRNFGSKALAINDAYARVRGLAFDLVGILDADVSFPPDYYERLLPRFEADPGLGIAGGGVVDFYRGAFVRRQISVAWSVRGPIQMFRRGCFEAIGGYRRLAGGGIDAIAEVMARMHGWHVRTFPELEVRHHRPTGTETQGFLKALVRVGRQNYVNGYHPLFMLARCLQRLNQRPYLLNAFAMLVGYAGAAVRRVPRQVPPDVVRFLRREQMMRLRRRMDRAPGGPTPGDPSAGVSPAGLK